MSLGLHEGRRRRQQRFWWGLVKWSLGFAMIVALGTYSYFIGNQLSQSKVADLQLEIDDLSVKLDQIGEEKNDLDKKLEAARAMARDWEDRYKKDVPSGPITEFIALTEQKLEAGIDPLRLRFLISSAANKRDCDGDPVSRRFLVSTALQQGGNDSVTFANNALTVTASGNSARDAQGNLEARFDPFQPVTVVFAHLGGEKTEISGPLPLHQSVVLGDSEYRFSASPAATNGFLKVTGERCAYP